MCGLAMASLNISQHDFDDMAPVEFFYAIQAKSELLKSEKEYEMRQRFEVARLEAVLIINNQLGRRAADFISDVRLVHKFGWEEEEKEGKDSVQSDEEMLRSAKRLALQMGSNVVAKGPDDPPANLAKQFRK